MESRLSRDDYETIMRAWDGYFTEHVEERTRHPSSKGIHFLGVQRWNSTSPAMGLSRGGGYFIFKTGDTGEVVYWFSVNWTNPVLV